MAASSVTGISGPGSAENNGMKGPGNGRNQYVPLVSPHVISANTTTLTGGTSLITFPAPYLGDKSKYMVFAQAVGGSGTHVNVTQMNNDEMGNFASFQLTGASGTVCNWLVVNRGVA
jgi:hypothetical protein